VDEPGSYVTPDPGAGLDYRIAATPPPAPSTPATPPPAPSTPAPDQHSHLPTGIIAFLSAIVGALATIGILSFAGFFNTDAPDAQPITTVAPTTVPPVTIVAGPTETQMVEAVWAKVFPSVVTIHVGEDDGEEVLINGSGSGVALGNGYVATNHHVIEGADVARIVLQDGRTYEATIVGSDPYTDLAVLSVDAADLVAVEIGSIDDLAIGQTTIAVGNPLGQRGGSSLTVGVLSALSRRVEFEDDTALFGMLQTDAPITNGSSGGALVDEEGRLIGITSAIGVSQAGAEGIGYAIPVDLVRRVTDELIATGTVHHAFLGILGGDYIETGADGALIPAGAQIIDVDPLDGAAGRAGLLTDDVIVGMEGVEISTMNQLVIQLRLYRVGETIGVRILRGNEELTVPVTLDERPDGV
jgi:S1-C subfamily serine protease